MPSSFTYQWVRVDADGTSNPVDITNANAATYTLTDDDEGKKIKVKVSFTDDLDSTETLTSAAYPSSGTVMGTNTAPFTAAWALDAYTADEGGSVTVTATLRTAENEPKPSESYLIRVITGSDSATAVADYTPVTTNLTVTPSVWEVDDAMFTATVAVTVETVEDSVLEGDERFYVMLSGADGEAQPGLECTDALRNVVSGVTGCATVVTIADDETLSVTEVTVSSTPAAGETYLAGEAIEFTVEFIASVTVTDTPTFAFTLGSAVRQATYASGSGTAALVFSYTVLADDLDRDGISWEADALALAGGTIRLMTDNATIMEDAALAHEGEDAQAAHRVDAVAPSLVSATAEDTTLELVYDEALDGDSAPATSAYTVAVTVGTTTNPTVLVSVAGTTVTLTLSAAPADGATVTVSYTVPTGMGAMPVQDVAGNDAPTFSGQSVSVGAPLRLVGGTGKHEGRLEILHDSQWGTVCDDYWTDVEAGVVCRILEFELGAVDNRGRTRDEGGRSLPPSFGPPPAGATMWLDNVNCVGNETSLLACPPRRNLAVGVHNCRPSEAVGVQCRIMPQVESVAVSPASGPYTAGGTLQVTVEWNQPVVVTTPAGGLAPKLMVQYGTGSVTQEHDAVYASGSGTAALVFEHRLAGGDSFESVKVLPNTLRVRGGAIVWKTDNGVDADLAHGTIVNNQLEAPVVVAAPAVVGAPALSEAGTDGLWTAGETVEVTLTFSESVTVATADGLPSIGLQLSGTQAQRAPYASGTGTAKLVFGYTLTDADGPHSTLLVPPDSLALNDGTIVSTASFSNLPSSHDGEKPFTVKLSFSAEPRGLSYKTVRDSLLEVTGGTVTEALRVTDASDREWNVTVEPSQGYDITLTLPAHACSVTAAVCIGGRPLSRPASATIAGKALTASLSGPDEHDGSKSFKVRLTFSMEPDVSYKTVRDTMFTEQGGTIKKAGRVAPPADLEFDITVEPDGDGAVCTAAGRKIEGTVSATIPGPVAISVADATVREGSGAVLAFEVTLDRARSEAVTVDYATVPGNGAGVATEGSDYTATSGTLTFAANETLKTVSVPVLVDTHDEDAETMTLTLASPSPSDYVRIADGTATGDDHQHRPGAWLARFGRTVGSQVLEAVSTRFDGSSAASHLNVGGARLGGTPLDAAAPLAPQDWLATQLAEGTEAQHPEERTLSAP